jgi:enoyl-CoA hydratase
MAWNIELADDCAVVSMNTNKFNVQNDFFADLHDAESRFTRAPRKAIVET